MYPRHKIDLCKPWPATRKEKVTVGEVEDREVERFGTVRKKPVRDVARREDVAGLGLGAG
jgi:hypothetical protein